jgi:hypothetical protein
VPIYDLGDGIPLRHLVYNGDGALTDATVSLTITKPDGSTATPTVTRTSLGQYDAATYVPDQVGTYAYSWNVVGGVTDVSYGTFAVADPGPPSYVALASVKSALGKLTADDRDDLIVQAISAASRFIERRTGRRFYADRTATARTFPIVGQSMYSAGEQVLLVDDIASLQDLAVSTGSSGNWSAVQMWDSGPDNAIVYGRPITEIRALSGWLARTGRVQVTARWGWPNVPDEITQATQLLASRLYRRKDSPEGVLGNAEWGTMRVSRIDPDVEALIAPFVIHSIA